MLTFGLSLCARKGARKGVRKGARIGTGSTQGFWERSGTSLLLTRGLSVIALGLWIAIIFAGRWIAYVDYLIY